MIKDIFSSITFGFVMAQRFPGLVTLLSVATLYTGLVTGCQLHVSVAAATAIKFLTDGAARNIFALMFATSFGMAIHGLNWVLLGFLEYYRKAGPAESKWHDFPFVLQILLGPIQLVFEVALLLFKARRPAQIAIEENAGRIPPEKWQAFAFLQSFYLNFAQFYAHTSFALLVAFISFFTYSVAVHSAPIYWVGVCLLYVATGGCFLISRVQFTALFNAEVDLARRRT